MLYLSDCLPSGGPPETKEKKLGSILISSKTPQHKTSFISSNSEAHRAPGHFPRKDGPVDFLGKKQSRVRKKGLEADT